jgi:hypothetical protein
VVVRTACALRPTRAAAMAIAVFFMVSPPDARSA